MFAPAAIVDSPGNQFLACAGFAMDEHCRIGVGDLVHILKQLHKLIYFLNFDSCFTWKICFCSIKGLKRHVKKHLSLVLLIQKYILQKKIDTVVILELMCF